MPRIILPLLLFTLFVMGSPAAFAAEGPQKPTVSRHINVSSGLSTLNDEELLRVARLHRTGGILLGTGFGIAVTGLILIEAFQYGPGALGGFIGTGVGITTLISGMFCLGFSRPLHGYSPSTHARISSVALGRGVSISGSF